MEVYCTQCISRQREIERLYLLCMITQRCTCILRHILFSKLPFMLIVFCLLWSSKVSRSLNAFVNHIAVLYKCVEYLFSLKFVCGCCKAVPLLYKLPISGVQLGIASALEHF